MRRFCLLILFSCMLLVGCEETAPNIDIQPVNVEVLAFTATWCEACQRDKPFLEQLRRHMKVIMVNADRHPQLLKRYGVNLLPTYIVFEDGIEVKRTGNIHSIAR